MKKIKIITLLTFVFLFAMLLMSACGGSDSDKKQGLMTENGNIVFYNDDGTLFTDGYKEVTTAGKTDYYFFKDNGTAFTSGYKTVKIDGATYFFYFEDDGKAFTNGLKEVSFSTQTYLCYFAENGRALTSDWATINGAKYYFQSNGCAAKDTFLTIGNDLYYFDASGSVENNGWFCVADGYYYANNSGVLSTSTVVEGYKLDANGKSTTKYRIVQLANAQINDSMTNQQKIQAIYNWIMNDKTMSYIRTYEHTSPSWVWKDSWVDDMAASLMDKWGGNCFRYAAFLGMLIREATGLEVTVYHGDCTTTDGGTTPHGWITVKQDGTWYIYDVELEKHANVAHSRCYKVLPSVSTIHLNGVGTNLF